MPDTELSFMEKQTSTLEEIGAVFSLPAPLQIRLFGGTEMTSDGVPLRRTRSRTETWLLAALLLRANHSVERAWLAAIFWPESRPVMALNNLRRSLSNLRQVLAEDAYRLVSSTPQTIAFDMADAFCDVTAFDTALARKDTASLRRAVELYRGPLLPDCDADWVLPERSTREQAFLTALETLATQSIQAGEAQEAVRFLRQILRIEPFRETSQRALLEALASQGDKAGLVLAYRQLRLLLHSELRAEPSADTKAHYQRLLERVSRQTTVVPAALASSIPSPASLLRIPWHVSELVGREKETTEFASLLNTHRLVTLTGSGGIGKTRLALAIAIQVAADFPDGVWFVDLASVTDPEQVLPAVARTLEVREAKGKGSLATLREYLGGKRLLLLLDNAEHLLSSCATLTATLLEALPELRVLVTSRQALGVAGEEVRRVPSLPFPEAVPADPRALTDLLLDYAGPRLFVTRALSASSTFVLTQRNAPAVRQICARLDGIPLALELAAARIASLSAEQIDERLKDSFRLLTSGVRTALPRQQTLRALVDWSYDLLDEPEKIMLARLSIFAGGWTIEAAESVCGFPPVDESHILDVLTSLVNQSLVLAEENDGSMRYRMLETLRQYATEKRELHYDSETVQRRHLDYFVVLAEETESKLRVTDQLLGLNRLESEHDNLRAALNRCSTDEESATLGLRLAGALGWFWWMRGYFGEGREQLTRVIENAKAQNRTEEWKDARKGAAAKAFNAAGTLARGQSDFEAARTLFSESLALRRELHDKSGVTHALNNLGVVAFDYGDFDTAHSLHEESLAISQEMDDKWGVANAFHNMGRIALECREFGAAQTMYDSCLVTYRALGDRRGVANALTNLGIVAADQDDVVTARPLYEESLAIFRELGEKRSIANALNNLGTLARVQGDYAASRPLHQESLLLRRELGDKVGIAYSLENLASLFAHASAYRTAATLWGASEALRESISCPLPSSEKVTYQDQWDETRSALGEVAYVGAWTEGRTLTMERVIEYTLKTADKS